MPPVKRKRTQTVITESTSTHGPTTEQLGPRVMIDDTTDDDQRPPQLRLMARLVPHADYPQWSTEPRPDARVFHYGVTLDDPAVTWHLLQDQSSLYHTVGELCRYIGMPSGTMRHSSYRLEHHVPPMRRAAPPPPGPSPAASVASAPTPTITTQPPIIDTPGPSHRISPIPPPVDPTVDFHLITVPITTQPVTIQPLISPPVDPTVDLHLITVPITTQPVTIQPLIPPPAPFGQLFEITSTIPTHDDPLDFSGLEIPSQLDLGAPLDPRASMGQGLEDWTGLDDLDIAQLEGIETIGATPRHTQDSNHRPF
ncbi:uncharacterized protein [Rutidosis leptorrhynchoides]|uniref:uncharacterized protein n=1 Tax=Rutidosis leptorrhynchoides TaxID=125765 RepID=UPI003A99B5CC